MRWEPPPKESQNGVLTGYKLKWRKSGKSSSGSQTVSTDGSRRLYAISGLKKGKQYQVKISALTVNGSGPATGWLYASTFESDLDETVVPEPPSSLRARAADDSITIMWIPPSSNSILVRGYTIGWGKGIPDEYTKVVDNKQRYFVIEDLSKSNKSHNRIKFASTNFSAAIDHRDAISHKSLRLVVNQLSNFCLQIVSRHIVGLPLEPH